MLVLRDNFGLGSPVMFLAMNVSSRHGANYIQFHERVKDEEPTFVIIETMTGEVFGGFASAPWRPTSKVSRAASARSLPTAII